ncbi:hypothetical protein BKI52_05955 [marine bacterium AO1-C]|nr:hypothetical protein BKI52_05955 [marine bacterium AO1-C]
MKRFITCLTLLCSLSFYATSQDTLNFNEKQQAIWQLFQDMKPYIEAGARSNNNGKKYNPASDLYAEAFIREYDNLVMELLPIIDFHLSYAQVKLATKRFQQKRFSLDFMPYNFHLVGIQLFQAGIIWIWNTALKIVQINDAGFAYYEGNYLKALRLAESNLQKNPNDALSLFYKGLALRDSLGDVQSFLQHTQRAIVLKPDFHHAYYQRAYYYLGLNQDDLANRDIDSALHYFSGFPDYLLVKAKVLYGTKKLQAAEDLLDEIIEINDDLEARRMRGIIHRDRKRYHLAIIDFDYGLRQNKDNVSFLDGRGFTYEEMGKYEKALDDFQRILKSEDASKQRKIYTYNNIGHTYYKMGKYDLALLKIEFSLAQDPKNSYAYKNRALVYIAQNKKDLACQDLRKAQQLGYTKLYGNEVEELLKRYCR